MMFSPFLPMRAVAAVVALATIAASAAPLPQLNIDKSQTTVSGASSGGYMAVQLHVAFSSSFRRGAAVIAGGPYNCAEGSVVNALTRCLGSASIPVAELVLTTRQWAKEGLIDPASNLSGSKVYLFSGANDSVVKEATSSALNAYYQQFLPQENIVYNKEIASEHAFVTDDFGAACLTKASPFINNCQFDLAGALLRHLYGSLNARNTGLIAGGLSQFDQTSFGTGHGMGATGWVYVPLNCASGTSCRLHVALHGCRQNSTDVGDVFVRNAGYNRWADTNSMVVLYPQTGKGATNGCWDWWGYDHADYAKKTAPQMMAIMAMVEWLSRGAPAPAKR